MRKQEQADGRTMCANVKMGRKATSFCLVDSHIRCTCQFAFASSFYDHEMFNRHFSVLCNSKKTHAHTHKGYLSFQSKCVSPTFNAYPLYSRTPVLRTVFDVFVWICYVPQSFLSPPCLRNSCLWRAPWFACSFTRCRKRYPSVPICSLHCGSLKPHRVVSLTSLFASCMPSSFTSTIEILSAESRSLDGNSQKA